MYFLIGTMFAVMIGSYMLAQYNPKVNHTFRFLAMVVKMLVLTIVGWAHARGRRVWVWGRCIGHSGPVMRGPSVAAPRTTPIMRRPLETQRKLVGKLSNLTQQILSTTSDSPEYTVGVGTCEDDTTTQ